MECRRAVWQISITAGAVVASSSNLGSAARARSRNSATAGMVASCSIGTVSRSSVGSGSTVQTCSPVTANGSRLVATIDTLGAARRIRSTRLATGLDEVFTVVEHEQRMPGPQHVDDRILDRQSVGGC